MRYNQAHKILRLGVPSDGYTDQEKQIVEAMFDQTIANVYKKLPTMRMKVIVALHFEAGYSQEIVASILGVTQAQIALDVRNIRRILKGDNVETRERKKKHSVEDFMWTLYHLVSG